MNEVYLCLGGNIGNRAYTMQFAISKIRDIVGHVTALSPLYETEAWGTPHQQAYFNQCLGVRTSLCANDLMAALLDIERQLGRKRNDTNGYEPRTIDIDVLFFNHDVIEQPQLIVPHPRLHLRKFVLVPLCDIAPNYRHPLLKETVRELLHRCEDPLKVYPLMETSTLPKRPTISNT